MAHKHTILVVDDESDVVRSVQDLLRLDYRVLGATRAVEGLEIMAREDVHVVMTDQRMPEMTGVEFLKRIRTDHPDTIRLLFTGYADIRAVIDAINQGSVYRYITKPWDPEELELIIREAVERYSLVAERKSLTVELRQRNQELERAYAELKSAEELKDAFISVASHELRTPIMILVGISELIMRKPGADGPLADEIKRMHAAGQRLKQLVEQIIGMLGAGRMGLPLERQPVDIGALLRQAADDVRLFVGTRGQILVVDIAADLGLMSLDQARMRSALDNLLLNAIKFTADGGRITLDARRMEGGGAEIRVADTGIGMDAPHLARLFKPFFTGFDTLNHSSGRYEFGRKGIGLGLSMVKSFIEMHGGTITVESDCDPGSERCGTTFIVRLPSPDPPDPQPGPLAFAD